MGDAIQLNSGASKVLIVGNYIRAVSADGISLTGNNDDCVINDNYLLNCGAYGIDIEAATCERNLVKDNYYSGNSSGAINDQGTDTRTHKVIVTAPNPDSYIGYHASQQMLDNVVTVVRFETPVPADFQELVTAHVIVVPEGTGNLACIDVTEYGRICHDEAYNAHEGSVDYTIGSVIAVTQNELECIDVSGTLASLTAHDWIGQAFIRSGAEAADTVNAAVQFLGFRLRYV